MMKILTTAAAATVLCLAGCHDTDDHGQRTGNDDLPSYTSGHYNPAVNSTGSGVGRNDPAIDPRAGDATGRVSGSGGGNSLNGGGSGATNLGGPSGTSDQNSGSSVPSGSTGNSSPGR